jgi:hypothetical protein
MESRTIEQVQQLVLDSQPGDFRYDESNGWFVHKRNPDLRIVLEASGAAGPQPVHEPWTKRFFDPNAYRQDVHVEYQGVRVVEGMLFVRVDGGRYLLPAPKNVADMTVTPFAFHVGRILNTQSRGYDYESGLWTAGIQVKAESRDHGT